MLLVLLWPPSGTHPSRTFNIHPTFLCPEHVELWEAADFDHMNVSLQVVSQHFYWSFILLHFMKNVEELVLGGLFWPTFFFQIPWNVRSAVIFSEGSAAEQPRTTLQFPLKAVVLENEFFSFSKIVIYQKLKTIFDLKTFLDAIQSTGKLQIRFFFSFW